jgi:hypothetical protein
MKTDKNGTCVYEKDIHVSHKGQGAATNREKGQGVTQTRAGVSFYIDSQISVHRKFKK